MYIAPGQGQTVLCVCVGGGAGGSPPIHEGSSWNLASKDPVVLEKMFENGGRQQTDDRACLYYAHTKKLSVTFFCNESVHKIPFSDHSGIFRACIQKVCRDADKINEVQRLSYFFFFFFFFFVFLATEDTKCHSWIFSIFLNIDLPLVFCTAQKTILANKHNAKSKKEACLINNWNQFWKTVQHLSCALSYIICILHWFLWKPKFYDNFWNRQYLNNSGVTI